MRMESHQPTRTTFATADGLSLVADVHHASGAPTLVFAHGFGQTRGAWNAAAGTMAARGCRCVTFDSRGHGESDRSPNGDYHMQQFANDLSTIAHAQPEPPVLVGASMGGLLGLVTAGETRPSPFRALVLVDITPRWETAGVERILAFMQAHPDGFASYAEAAEQIAAYLPQRRERKSEQQLRPLLREGVDGRLRWHWDPALLSGDLVSESERYQPRLLEAAAKVDVPVLLLSGERSDVVSHRTVDEFLALVPHARHAEVPGATHMLAGDANDAFAAAIAGFIESLEPVGVQEDATKSSAMRC
jgi:pimeloyl-ACP methyl ester carboxylesterase